MSTSTRLRSHTIEGTIDLFVTDCARCGVIFAITSALEARRREDHGDFYCPNGHVMAFRGETEADKIQKQLDMEKRRHGWTRESLEASREVAKSADYRARAAKGQLTKMRNRVARGLCPAAGCKRSFTNLHDHMCSEHPEIVEQLS